MKKLKQKYWMTLSEAARHLSNMTDGGPVNELDILQYAMNREIMLSLRITQKISEPIWGSALVPADELSDKEQEAHWEETSNLCLQESLVAYTRYGGRPYVGLMRELTCLATAAQVYDINADTCATEFYLRLWNRCQKGEIADCNICTPEDPLFQDVYGTGETQKWGPFLTLVAAKSSTLSVLPTYLIPDDSYLVVRSAELQKLFEVEPPPSIEKAQLSSKEKKTYLKVIRTLCQGHEHIDLNAHSTAANQLIAMADTMALSIPSKRTLETLLKEARELDD